MVQGSNGTALRQIHVLFNVGTIGGLTDGQLLERFTSRDDETAELAFTAIIERHGPMVLRVCQAVLRERHDAEDAFQATFLILARKAASIRKQGSVVSWLHGVAFRTASCQRGATSRRRRHERSIAGQAVGWSDVNDREERSLVLHDELDRLSEKYRLPLVLCYFEGLTHEQAARQLGWPVGTVRSRLARGREQLRGRLMRRGLAPSIVLLEKALCAEGAKAAVPSALANATAHAALHYASGGLIATGITSTSVALMVEGAMNVMFLTKMKFALAACGLIATGALVVAQQVGTSAHETESLSASVSPPQSRPALSGAPNNDDAIVAREMGQLDVDLLAEEVQQLREHVGATLRDKLKAERTKPESVGVAQSAYEAARASYLAKARELKVAQRDLSSAGARSELSVASITPAPVNVDRTIGGQAVSEVRTRPSAAVVGSIDMDAVFKRYEKVKTSTNEYSAALLTRKNELTTIMAEAMKESQILNKLVHGSDDYRDHENRVTELKARHEAGREQAEREFAQRQTTMMAALYKEIHEAVAALAKAKGLTYVVKVSPGPHAESTDADVRAVMGSSVIYADLRNDLTNEVISNLNRSYKAAEPKIAK